MGIDFLENYCEMDILLHIVRVFPDDNITHVIALLCFLRFITQYKVEETIDPIRDIAIVNKEILEKVNTILLSFFISSCLNRLVTIRTLNSLVFCWPLKKW